MTEIETMATDDSQEEPDKVCNEQFIVVCPTVLSSLGHGRIDRSDLLWGQLSLLVDGLGGLGLWLRLRRRFLSEMVVIVDHIPSV
jgi:hypothetical protein